MRTKNSSRNGTKYVFIVHPYKCFPIKAIMSIRILRSLKCKFNCLFLFSKNILVRHCQTSPKIFSTYYCQLTRGISLNLLVLPLGMSQERGLGVGVNDWTFAVKAYSMIYTLTMRKKRILHFWKENYHW